MLLLSKIESVILYENNRMSCVNKLICIINMKKWQIINLVDFNLNILKIKSIAIHNCNDIVKSIEQTKKIERKWGY